MSADEIMRRDALDHLRVTVELARQSGVEPADILETVHRAMPDLIVPDDPPPVEASPFSVRRDRYGAAGLYIGDAWITDETSTLMDDARNPHEYRTALNGMLANALRPLFDGSVVTR